MNTSGIAMIWVAKDSLIPPTKEALVTKEYDLCLVQINLYHCGNADYEIQLTLLVSNIDIALVQELYLSTIGFLD